jgi:hypothetical protein
MDDMGMQTGRYYLMADQDASPTEQKPEHPIYTYERILV